MIRKCTEADLDILNEYLYREKELNLFVISDIEVFGFEDSNIEVFIDYDNTIRTVYLRFFNNMCLVSYDNIIDFEFLKSIIDEHSIANINGERDLINQIKMDNFRVEDYYFSSLTELEVEVDDSGVREFLSNTLMRLTKFLTIKVIMKLLKLNLRKIPSIYLFAKRMEKLSVEPARVRNPKSLQ